MPEAQRQLSKQMDWLPRFHRVSSLLSKLTPLDFFLWDVLKNSVCPKKVNAKDQLLAMIVNSCTKSSEELCRSVCDSLVRRNEKCIEEDGQHFEHLLR